MSPDDVVRERRTMTELKGLALELYLYMIKHPLDTDDKPFLTKKGDVQYSLSRMERDGLIKKKREGLYVILEERILDIVITHLHWLNERAMRRHNFYITFIISSLVIFVSYILFLPRTLFTAEAYMLGFALFSLSASALETIVIRRRSQMLGRLLINNPPT